jgi:antitoxin CptB
MREADLILGPFADDRLYQLTPLQIEQYASLLDCTDVKILDWLYGHAPIDENIDATMIEMIRDFTKIKDE